MKLILILLSISFECCFAKGQASNILIDGKAVKPGHNRAYNVCLKSDGKIVAQYTGSHKIYFVCVFEDNHQCELAALERGWCKPGGVRIIGYDNPAQVYCAIQGGRVLAVKNAICTLPNGKKYSAAWLYNK